MPCRKIEQAARSFLRAKRMRDPVESNRCRAGVVRRRMWQDHGMGLGVWKAEGSAKNVTELMMQRHPYRAEAGSTGPRSEQRIGPGIAVGRVRNDPGQRTSERGNALLGEIRNDRVGFLCVQRLHGV